MHDCPRIAVLDHGFVTLRNIAGPTRRAFDYGPTTDRDGEALEEFRAFDADDTDPANAARMSFGETDSGRTEDADMKLSAYLMRNRHTSPFEMISVWLEMKLPIFVARQFVRHRTIRLNEISGRYVTLPAEWYIPEVVGGKAKNVKQGQEDNLEDWVKDDFKDVLNGQCRMSYGLYLHYLDKGVAPEHARMFLHLNHYTHWLWNQDLHNLMHFLSLRADSHAQVEAQAYARAVMELVRQQLPRTMELYDKYRGEQS